MDKQAATKYEFELTLVDGDCHHFEETWTDTEWLTNCKITDISVLTDMMMRKFFIVEDEMAINADHVVSIRILDKSPVELDEQKF